MQGSMEVTPHLSDIRQWPLYQQAQALPLGRGSERATRMCASVVYGLL